MRDRVVRCAWAEGDLLVETYHDEEWGVPLHDDHRLFEFLILEGAQAGLSWTTILRKRENYRRAYANFDPAQVARYTPRKAEALLHDPGIVRNRAKVEASIANAKAFVAVQSEFGSFDAYIWDYVDGVPIQNRWESLSDLPAKTPLSEAISRDLKGRGFRFVGPTIVYAHMQATGMVNDHVVDCFRYEPIRQMGR